MIASLVSTGPGGTAAACRCRTPDMSLPVLVGLLALVLVGSAVAAVLAQRRVRRSRAAGMPGHDVPAVADGPSEVSVVNRGVRQGRFLAEDDG
jgi:hypothetical protein